MSNNDIVTPRKLVHSGKKRAYPSQFVWDCPVCNQFNIWQTRMLHGKVHVICRGCLNNFILDKSNPKEEMVRSKNMKSIIDK